MLFILCRFDGLVFALGNCSLVRVAGLPLVFVVCVVVCLVFCCGLCLCGRVYLLDSCLRVVVVG